MRLNVVILFALVSLLSVKAFPNPRTDLKFAELREEKFDNFILANIDIFQDDIKDKVYHVGGFPYQIFNSTYHAMGNISDSEVRGIPAFNVAISSNLTALQLSINLTFPAVTTSANYSLNGMTDEFIALNGYGRLSQMVPGVHWQLDATLEIDSDGYVKIPGTLTALGYYAVNSTFEGIDNEENIGDLIQDDLQDLGTLFFYEIEFHVVSQFIEALFYYLNAALQTVTLEEILGKGTIAGYQLSNNLNSTDYHRVSVLDKIDIKRKM